METDRMDARIISVTSDFGVQSQAVGVMEAVAYQISPQTKYLNLTHGLPAFDLLSAARSFEAVVDLPIGNHVCVCDPGVGHYRTGVIIAAHRGDYLIGPDNGVLLPAARRLGGVTSVHAIENGNYQRQPVSPIFHGRDVYVPAAAHLSEGVGIERFGAPIEAHALCQASFEEAAPSGARIRALVIHENSYGSLVLNILADIWDEFAPDLGSSITLRPHDGGAFQVTHGTTYADVDYNGDVIIKDDYGRVELATHHGSFSAKHQISVGTVVDIFTD